MSESNQLMDFTNMFRNNEENNENMRTNLHEASFTSSLSKGSMEEPTSLELYYPEIPEEDFRNLPSSVHTLLTNLVSQVLLFFSLFLFFVKNQFDCFHYLIETFFF